MEPKLKLKVRLSWHKIMSLGLTPDQIRHTWRCWLDSCGKYKELEMHCYDDHAVIGLTERKSRQMLRPEIIPYSAMWIARTGTHWPPEPDDPFLLLVNHPTAGQVVTLIRDRDFAPGSMCEMVRTVDAGRKAEQAAAYQRGF